MVSRSQNCARDRLWHRCYVLCGIAVAASAGAVRRQRNSLAAGLGYAAQRLGPEVSLFQMDARAIPFSSEFDLIAACDVLEHLDNDVKALSEIHRKYPSPAAVVLFVPSPSIRCSGAKLTSLPAMCAATGGTNSPRNAATLVLMLSRTLPSYLACYP